MAHVVVAVSRAGENAMQIKKNIYLHLKMQALMCVCVLLLDRLPKAQIKRREDAEVNANSKKIHKTQQQQQQHSISVHLRRRSSIKCICHTAYLLLHINLFVCSLK